MNCPGQVALTGLRTLKEDAINQWLSHPRYPSVNFVNENENINENTYKNGEKTETTIQKTKTIIESKTKLHVKTKIVQPTDLPYHLIN